MRSACNLLSGLFVHVCANGSAGQNLRIGLDVPPFYWNQCAKRKARKSAGRIHIGGDMEETDISINPWETNARARLV
ncbi:hypothetical protein PCAR4_1140019 [Paraburkholderia caribensis]|nr:hypothetical protein PCAR4_1140019 [Paraburkholderia caribensis]